MAKKVLVEVDEATGEISVDVNGVIGTSCEDIQKAFSTGERIKDIKKPEYKALKGGQKTVNQ